MLEYRAKAADFGAWLDRNVNKVGYLIGTRGQVCTQSMIDARLASVSYKEYWDTLPLAKQWIGKVVADCEGLYDMFMNGGEWDKPLTKWPYDDTTANGIFALAKSSGLKTGDIPDIPRNEKFPIGVHFDGHVGFWYKGVVYQSIGHRRGFITTDLSEPVNNKHWTSWYYIPYLDYSGASGGGGEPDMYCKFGETSQTVNDLQKKLMQVYGQLVGDNGTVYKPGQETSYYGTATKNGVLDLLKEYGLPGDGKTFDDLASAALTFKLAGIVPESAALKQKIAELERNLLNVNNLLLVEQNLSAQWAASDSAKKAELVKIADAFDMLKAIADKY